MIIIVPFLYFTVITVFFARNYLQKDTSMHTCTRTLEAHRMLFGLSEVTDGKSGVYYDIDCYIH